MRRVRHQLTIMMMMGQFSLPWPDDYYYHYYCCRTQLSLVSAAVEEIQLLLRLKQIYNVPFMVVVVTRTHLQNVCQSTSAR